MRTGTEIVHVGCPVDATLSVIGGKWKGIILFHLTMDTIRYNELQRRLPTVTPRILAKQLRELEEDGVVHREVYQEIPPKVEYSLTEFGRTLIPILNLMEAWGNQLILNILEEGNVESTSSARIAQLRKALFEPQDVRYETEQSTSEKASPV